MGTYNYQVENSELVVYARTLKQMKVKLEDLVVKAKDLTFTANNFKVKKDLDKQEDISSNDILREEGVKKFVFPILNTTIAVYADTESESVSKLQGMTFKANDLSLGKPAVSLATEEEVNKYCKEDTSVVYKGKKYDEVVFYVRGKRDTANLANNRTVLSTIKTLQYNGVNVELVFEDELLTNSGGTEHNLAITLIGLNSEKYRNSPFIVLTQDTYGFDETERQVFDELDADVALLEDFISIYLYLISRN